jgi:hypothetical protein
MVPIQRKDRELMLGMKSNPLFSSRWQIVTGRAFWMDLGRCESGLFLSLSIRIIYDSWINNNDNV